MTEIHYPIDVTDVKSIIPAGEEIIYSTMCVGRITLTVGNRGKMYTWNTHLLITSEGIACYQLDKRKPKNPLKLTYTKWIDIFGISYANKNLGVGIGANNCRYTLAYDISIETEEHFLRRRIAFLFKFLPYLIKLKEQWVSENENNPEIKKKIKKRIIKEIKGNQFHLNRMFARKKKLEAEIEKTISKLKAKEEKKKK